MNDECTPAAEDAAPSAPATEDEAPSTPAVEGTAPEAISHSDRLAAHAEGRPLLTAAIVFFFFLVIGITIDNRVPWTDDARFYVPAAAAYGEWAVAALTFDSNAWSRTGIEHAFRENHEHPPVGKYAMAATWLVFHRWTGMVDEVRACRLGVILLWAMMVAMVFWCISRIRGLGPGLFGAFALATMPRVLFDGQVETLDLPVAALTVATFALLWQCLENPRWPIIAATVVVFGLALGTKLNAPFFLVALFAYWLLLSPPRRTPQGLRLGSVPVVILGMTLVSPLIVWLVWPWMWFDTLARLQQYLQYHLHHYNILFYFRGVLYSEEVAPWYAPTLLAGVTVPVCILLLAAFGAWLAARAIAARMRSFRCPGNDPLADNANARFAVLAAITGTVQLVAVSLPGVPVYGGVKLFLPAFPFIAILAGLGFAELQQEIQKVVQRIHLRPWLSGGLAVALLLPGLLGVFAYHGAWLSYYNEPAGGLRGAVAAGYERQYYDLAYPEIPKALNDLLPNGGSVAFLPNPKEYTPYLARWQKSGDLHRNIRRAPPENADLLVLTHERRWQEYPELQARYRTYRLAAQQKVAGVPLFSIYDLR